MTYQEFMPNWKKQDQCFEEEKIEMVDKLNGRKVMKDGKPVMTAWPHDKPTPQIAYENWLKKVVNPDTNEFYPARNKEGNPIKNTGGKHVVRQIIRFRRKDGSEYLYSLGTLYAHDALGNVVNCNCAKPEMWTRTLFNYERHYDERTNSTKVQTTGTLGSEEVYELPFNEKNSKELVSQRENDSDIQFIVKDEEGGSRSPQSIRKEANIAETIKLFLKPFDYLINAEYIIPQQKAQLRQMAVDAGIIAPSTPLEPTNTAPPKGTYT